MNLRGKRALNVLASGAIVIALASMARFVVGSIGGSAAGAAIGLCALTSPDDMAIGLYLESRAADLEQPAGSDDTPITFAIQSGETVPQIATRLQEQGLISDGELFRRYVQYHGLDATIEAGQFTLRQTMTIPQIAESLQQGQRREQTATVPEGLRLEEVAEAVAEQTSISREDFLVAAIGGWREAGLVAEFPLLAELPLTATLEGFLFPETYRLPEEPTAMDLIRRMLQVLEQRVTPEVRAAALDRGLNVYQLVTLASIVEREAVLPEERPLIAGVYHNRMSAGWPLAADPTVQYGLGAAGNWWPQLSVADLGLEMDYNTYRHIGLPPGPICSPGLSSIQAVAYPKESEYFFFLADCEKKDGSHLFTVTYEEHMALYERCQSAAP